VLPGGQYTFNFTLTAPATGTTATTTWRMVHEGVAFFGGTASSSVQMSCGTDDATIVTDTLPTQMACNGSYGACVTVKNTGSNTWTPEVYKLGAPGANDPLGGPARVYLTSSVPPGGQYTFCFTLTAPAADTTVTTTWQMVHEKVAFFGGAASQAVTVSCGGGSAQCTSGIKPYPWKPQYLADPVTGQPVLLTGQGSIVPGKYTREQTSDYIDRFRASGIRYVRVWTLQLEDSANWPWTITADGPYFNQGVHWDWNPTYWDRLRAALAYADSADPSQVVYAEVQLFDSGCTGFDHGGFVSSTDPGNQRCIDFQASGRSEGSLQAMWVDKLISETCQFRNVFYEIQNEPRDRFGGFLQNEQASTEWWSRFVKARTVSAVAMSFVPPTDPSDLPKIKDLRQWDLSSVDIVDIHNDDLMTTTPQTVASQVNACALLGKAVSLDEFGSDACVGGQCLPNSPGGGGLDTLRRAAWAALSSGAHFHMEDVDGAMSSPELVGDILRNINAFKQRWPFWVFAPSTAVRVLNAADDGPVDASCMTESAPSHVCYVPSVPVGNDTIRIELPALEGGWHAYLWNPRGDGADFVGEYQASTPTEIVVGLPAGETDAGKRDWVLYVLPGAVTPPRLGAAAVQQ